MTHPSGNLATDDYVWDQGASLPQVLQDANTVNGVASTTTYLYGLNGLLATTDGGGTTRYYLQDGLGSTAQLTDTGGSVTDSYTYDVFGATTHTGRAHSRSRTRASSRTRARTAGSCTCGRGCMTRRSGGSSRRIRSRLGSATRMPGTVR